MTSQLLNNRVAIITGGAGGLGSAMASTFIDQGGQVVIADINPEKGSELVNRLGQSAVFFQTDVTRKKQIQALVDFTIDRFNRLDIMINNAGQSGPVHTRFLDDDFAEFEQLMAVNLLSVMAGSRYASKAMQAHGGSIINVTSLAALNPGCPLLTYRAAKAGVIHFSKSIARDLAEYNIRVNCIAPGRVPAGMTFYDMSASIRQHQPLQRQGTPQDVANAALYLASDLSLHVTGLVLPVDGGANLGGPLNSDHAKIV